MTTKPHDRYDLRRISDDNWEIYDTVTGRTVTIGGEPAPA
jgi:hypothetical protein